MLALVVTGFAWRSIDSLRNNLATAGGLGLGGSADGAVDILMVGTDSRTDAHGNPLSQDELDSLRAGEEVASNTDTIVLIRVPNDGSSATAISIPRDSYVDVPGIGMSKINAAYGATKETERLELVEDGATDKEAEKESTKAGREALIQSVAESHRDHRRPLRRGRAARIRPAHQRRRRRRRLPQRTGGRVHVRRALPRR